MRKISSYIGLSAMIVLFIAGIAPIAHLIVIVSIKGIQVISTNFPSYLFQERALPGSSEIGGVGPYILGTLVLVAIASAMGIPVSIFAAIYTTQSIRSRVGPLTSTIVRALIEFPTIIVGLTVYGMLRGVEAVMGLLGLQSPIPRFSALSGAIALAIVMLPFIYTQTEESLKGIPIHLREAIYSLGASRIAASMILVRYVRASILAGIGIGVGKAMGETAPLLFTAFGRDIYPEPSPRMLFEPIGSLTLAIYNMGLSGYSNWVDSAWGAAFILLAITIGLFIAIRIIASR